MKSLSDFEILMFLLVEQSFSFEDKVRLSSLEIKDMLKSQNADINQIYDQIKLLFALLKTVIKNQEENKTAIHKISESIKQKEEVESVKKCDHEEVLNKYIEEKEKRHMN